MPSAQERARSGRLDTPPSCNRNPASTQSGAQKRKRRREAKNTNAARPDQVRPYGAPGRENTLGDDDKRAPPEEGTL
eukprot:13298744-Alexandrium_andersonii.AAC.1